MVPMTPTTRPEFLKADGIARIPVPRHAFSKCSTDPIFLQIKENIVRKPTSPNRVSKVLKKTLVPYIELVTLD